jgi:Na+/melibiose symporter-like transporter
MQDVPVQYYQTVVAIQLAVTGALLFQIRFFDPEQTIGGRHAWRRLGIAIVLGSTLFGCLYGIRHGSGSGAAAAVTAGLALSIVPILMRVLPPLASGARGGDHDDQRAVTVVALVLYAIATAAIVLTLNR